MWNNFTKQNKGFTLIEVLVVISIMLIATYISMDYLSLAFKTVRFSDEQSTAVQVARNTMEIIVKEIRGANTSEQGDYTLAAINDDDLAFYSDVDNDDVFEKVRYLVSSTTLLRIITEPGPSNDYSIEGATSTIAQYLNNGEDAIFEYYDENNTETAAINTVRLIRIILKINVTPTIAPNDIFVISDVNLRNLKDNL